MSKKAYDWSSELGLALVADEHFVDVEYVAIEDAPEAAADYANGHFLLPILHALANARRAGGFLGADDVGADAGKWARYGLVRHVPIGAASEVWS